MTSLFLSIFIILAGFLFQAQTVQAENPVDFQAAVDAETSSVDMSQFTDATAEDLTTGAGQSAAYSDSTDTMAIDPGKVGWSKHDVNTKGGTVGGCTGLSVFNGKCLLIGVLQFNGMLLATSAALFGFVVDADKLKLVVDNDALYTVWMEVRDFLNIAFILFLLYSAFSIIFQIGGKFGEKKIILTIVLMALLVNFSFPIARFIVDISNSLMYTMLAQFFPASVEDPTSIFTGITEGSAITKILDTPAGADYSQLLAAIFFIFLLAMTFLALAVLFLIRVIALAILIIVSPVAFVGNIAGKDFGWWDNMIKYAFFGPIMVFVLHIAIFTMTALGASAGLASNDDTISNMANVIIPIAILWMGMGIAQKMGIEGASTVMGAAQKVSKGAAKKFSGFNMIKANYDAYTGARKKRSDEKNKNRLGGKLGNNINDWQDRTLAMGNKDSKAGKRYNKSKDTKNKEDIKNESEKHDGATETALHTDIKGMTPVAVSTMSNDDVKAAAGKVKQALSRGTKYEKEIEKDLKTLAVGTVGLSGTAKPITVTRAVITGNPATDALEKDRERTEKEAMDKWIQEEKSMLMDQARNVIKEAEDRDKIK